MMMRLPVTLITLLVVLGTAHADQVKARDHIDKAMEAHEAGNFDVALAELTRAYELDPQDELLFAIGQVHTKLGNCRRAIEFYDKFDATLTDKGEKAVVAQAIAACRKQLENEPPPEPPATVVTEPDPEPAPFQDRPRDSTPIRAAERAPWYKDPIGDALVAGGAVAIVGGLVVYLGARSTLGDAEAAPNHERYLELVDDARSKRTYSVLLVGGGLALIGGGVVRYKLRSKPSTQIGLAPVRDGGFVTFAGRF
jgi:tetratricopeptide (TPR) repeat protein